MMPNKTWVVFRLGLWCHKATALFLYDRIYRHGCKWTPLCIKSFRYVGGIGCYTDDVLAIHEHIGYDKGFRDGYAEAVDAMPVVRCKDCKWRPRNLGEGVYVEHLDFPLDSDGDAVCPYAADDPWYNKEPHPYGFCQLGVREEEHNDS